MTHDFCNSFKLRRKLILLELKFKIYMDDNAVKENYKVKIVQDVDFLDWCYGMLINFGQLFIFYSGRIQGPVQKFLIGSFKFAFVIFN